MAGNAFFLDKVADTWLKDDGYWNLNAGADERVFVALVSIGLAYASLFGTPKQRWPVALELCAAFGFVVSSVWWLYVVNAVGHG
jgi:hypothetical protein